MSTSDQINPDDGAEAMTLGVLLFCFVIGLIIIGWLSYKQNGHIGRQDLAACTKHDHKLDSEKFKAITPYGVIETGE